MRVCGLVLAAGAGTRFGGPKGLARTASGEPWVQRAVRMLRDGGCDDVLVAVGASGDEVAALVPPDAVAVRVPDWADGLSATVRTALGAAAAAGADVVVITPVDTPDASPDAVRRVLGAVSVDTAARAAYGGVPGHPVAIGRRHFASVAASVTGDRGASAQLEALSARIVECGDLWSGLDIDEGDAGGPPARGAGTRGA